MHPNEYSNLLHSVKSEKRNKISDVLEYDSISEKDILPVQRQNNYDAVSLSIKGLCKVITNCILLWVFAYVMIMMQNIADSHIPLLLFFIPMWIGTIYGFISIIIIVKKVFRNGSTLIKEDRRLFMESEGISTQEYIDFSSLPLLRKLLFWCFISSISLILIFISQISFYIWLTTGIIGFWYSILPIILLHFSLLGACVVSKTFSFSTCLILLLSAVELALLIGKFEFSELCWSIVIIPLVIIECILLSHMKYILIKQYKGIIRMNKRQIICLFCYSISITLTILTNIVTVYNDIKNKNINSESKVFEDHTYLEIFPMIAWIFIVILFLGAILAIFDQEMNELARSRGFTTPLELSRSAEGWVMNENELNSVLLGTIKIQKIPLFSNKSISYTKKLPRSLLTSGLGLAQLRIRKKNDIDIKHKKIDNVNSLIDNDNINIDNTYQNYNRYMTKENNADIDKNINNNPSILNKLKNYFTYKPSGNNGDIVGINSEELFQMKDIEMNSNFEAKAIEKRKVAANAAETRRINLLQSDNLDRKQTSLTHSMNSLGVKNPYPKPDPRGKKSHPNSGKNPYPTKSLDGQKNCLEDLVTNDSEKIDEIISIADIDIKISEEISNSYKKLSNSSDGLTNNYKNISTSPKIGSIIYSPINYLKNMISSFTNTNKSENDINSAADNYVSTTDSTVDLSRDRSFKFREQSSFKYGARNGVIGDIKDRGDRVGGRWSERGDKGGEGGREERGRVEGKNRTPSPQGLDTSHDNPSDSVNLIDSPNIDLYEYNSPSRDTYFYIPQSDSNPSLYTSPNTNDSYEESSTYNTLSNDTSAFFLHSSPNTNDSQKDTITYDSPPKDAYFQIPLIATPPTDPFLNTPPRGQI